MTNEKEEVHEAEQAFRVQEVRKLFKGLPRGITFEEAMERRGSEYDQYNDPPHYRYVDPYWDAHPIRIKIHARNEEIYSAEYTTAEEAIEALQQLEASHLVLPLSTRMDQWHRRLRAKISER